MSEQKDWVKTVLKLPLPLQVAIGAVLLIGFLLINARRPNNPGGDPRGNKDDSGGVPSADAEGYLFCFWNVENLFDDVDDRRGQVDEKYDNLFAGDEKLRETKLGNLSKILLAMNGGKGPDILAVAEVESERALELLQNRLNADLADRAKKYVHRLFKEQKVGRHIAPGILTRLPIDGDRTHNPGQRYQRMLEGHIVIDGKQLVVVVSHWTSRVARPGGGDDPNNEEGRKKYADVVYGRFKEMYLANPKIAYLACGDFNDDPTDVSIVDHLRGIADRTKLTVGDEPRLFNLAAHRDLDHFGTLNHHNRWHLFDQILVSPAMLDGASWTCDPKTFRTERAKMQNRRGRPWGFDEDDAGHRSYDKKFNGGRGFADHFPVTARLKVKE